MPITSRNEKELVRLSLDGLKPANFSSPRFDHPGSPVFTKRLIWRGSSAGYGDRSSETKVDHR